MDNSEKPSIYEIPREISISINDKQKIFPASINILNKLRMTDIGLFSTTPAIHANFTMEIVMQYFSKKELSEMTITDANGCVGGNTYSMLKLFKKINFVEISNLHVEIFRHNLMALYPNYTSNTNIIKNIEIFNENYLNLYDKLQQDILFIDPPWGGIDYKKRVNIDLVYKSQEGVDVSISELINNHLHKMAKLILIKIPTNYDYKKIENKFKYVDVIPLLRENGTPIYMIIILSHVPIKYPMKRRVFRFPSLKYKNMKYEFI